jgi:hypothetical protein
MFFKVGAYSHLGSELPMVICTHHTPVPNAGHYFAHTALHFQVKDGQSPVHN